MLVEAGADGVQRLPGLDVAWSQLHGPLELPKRLPPAPLLEVDAPKVHEGELARLVASSLLGLLQPGDGLVELPLLHQVDSDVVIRIAEVRVDLDRVETLLGRLVEFALEAQGPSEERVRVRRRVHLDRAPVAVDRVIQLALHLVPAALLPELRGAPQTFRLFHTASPVSATATTRLAGPPGRTARSGVPLKIIRLLMHPVQEARPHSLQRERRQRPARD